MNIAVAKTAAPALRAPFPYWHELSLGILLIAGLATASALDPRFTQPSVQIEQAGDLWPLAFVSIAMAMIVITGGIDLSVGAMTGLAVVVIGLASEAGMSFSVSMVLGLATSVAAGFLNGFFVAKLAIHPLIVTLATMAGYRGIALALTRGRTIESIPADYAQAIKASIGDCRCRCGVFWARWRRRRCFCQSLPMADSCMRLVTTRRPPGTREFRWPASRWRSIRFPDWPAALPPS
jgi:ribose/xylose/arabinose/galactoside ABC-type transport system permease subunit